MGSEVNDFEEVKFRVETAQKMVGSATISMDRTHWSMPLLQ